MSVPFIGAQGLFTRLGHDIAGETEACSFLSTTVGARVTTINDDYTSTDQAVINGANGLYAQQAAVQTTLQPWMAYMQALTQSNLITMINDDTPLASLDTNTAIDQLNVDLQVAGSGISAPTLSLTVTDTGNQTNIVVGVPTNVGDAVVKASYYQGDGNQCDYMFDETISLIVTSDSATGATAYQEPIQCTTPPAVDVKAYNWPQGSGVSKSISIQSGSSTTKISNGNFDTWTDPAQFPSNWVAAVSGSGSSANTTVKRQATTKLPTSANYSCEFAGNGSATMGIMQSLTLSSNPGTVFGVGVWLRLSGVPASGVLTMALTQADGTLLADDQGVDCSATQTLTSGVSTSGWTLFSAFFRTPLTIPATTYLQLYCSTFLSNSVSLYLAKVVFQASDQMYAGGPFLTAFSGGTPSRKGDTYSVVATNSKTTSSFCRSLDRNWGLRVNNKRVLTGGGISDLLIV